MKVFHSCVLCTLGLGVIAHTVAMGSPAATQKDATKKSATQAHSAAQSPSITKSFDSLKWSETTPNNPLPTSVLWGDPSKGPYGMYLKLPGGFEAGLHTHTADYHGVLVAGLWEHWDAGHKATTKLAPGSYVMQPGKAPHGDRCASKEPCVILLIQDHKRDYIPVP